MKARYRYRIYPTPHQQVRLDQLFGCCRVVWNDALGHCREEYKSGNNKPKSSTLQKQFITQAKQTETRTWLAEVSSIPLQQSIRDLEQAYSNFVQVLSGREERASC